MQAAVIKRFQPRCTVDMDVGLRTGGGGGRDQMGMGKSNMGLIGKQGKYEKLCSWFELIIHIFNLCISVYHSIIFYVH